MATKRIICKTTEQVWNAMLTKEARVSTLVLDFKDASWLFAGLVLPKWLKIDTSKVTDLTNTFNGTTIKCDLSKLNTSNVKYMYATFDSAIFTDVQDFSKWDTSKVTDMHGMFQSSNFTGNISTWDVSNVVDMSSMFLNTPFNGDISKWNVSKVRIVYAMFKGGKFNQNISIWKLYDGSGRKKTIMADAHGMFGKGKISLRKEFWPKINNYSDGNINNTLPADEKYLSQQDQIKKFRSSGKVADSSTFADRIKDPIEYLKKKEKEIKSKDKKVKSTNKEKDQPMKKESQIKEADGQKIVCNTDIDVWEAATNEENKGKIIVINFKDARNLFINVTVPAWLKFDTTKVVYASSMFESSTVLCDLSGLDVSHIVDMTNMFRNAKFDGDISKWNVIKVKKFKNIFTGCNIKEEHMPQFEIDFDDDYEDRNNRDLSY